MTDYVLKATEQKVYPEENVVEVMKANHSFMNYEQLKDKLWFIPIDGFVMIIWYIYYS